MKHDPAKAKRGVRRPSPPRKSNPRTPDRFLFLAVILVVIVVLLTGWLYLSAEHRIAGEWGYCLDDSWIYATFARNLATGHGYSFNPGETVSGSTGPLYTFILAILYLLFHEVIWSAKVFGMVCHAGAAMAAYATMTGLLPQRRPLALVTAVIVASAPPLVWGMLSGMEIPLYLLLVLSGLAFYVRSRYMLAIILWSIGVWARPDGLYLVALGLLGPPKEIVRRLAVATPIIAGFLGFNMITGGHWMPQTVGTKAHLSLDVLGHTWTILRECGELWGIPFRRSTSLDMPVLLLPFLLLGAILTIRKRPILALYALGFPIALSLFQAGTASEKRYVLYIIPFGVILAAMAWNQIDAWLEHRWAHAGMTAAAACLAMQCLILPKRADFYGWNVQNINKMQITLAKFTKLITKPGDVIAVNDIGAMGYFSERYVVDLVGLVTPKATFRENLQRYKPNLLVIFVSWFRDDAVDDPATGNFKFFTADSSYRYELLAGVDLWKNTICGGNRMTAYVRLGRDEPSPTKRWLYAF